MYVSVCSHVCLDDSDCMCICVSECVCVCMHVLITIRGSELISFENTPAAQRLLGSRRRQVRDLILVSGSVSKEELKRGLAFLQVKIKHGISRSLCKSK